MHPVLKRVLLHGGATAVILAAIGLLFVELVATLTGGPAQPGQAPRADPDPKVSAVIRYRVPLMMAFWGFVFVAVSELVLSRVRPRAPVKPAEPPADDAEKLLNELLAQAEAKMALDAESQKAEEQKRAPGDAPHEKKEKAEG